jgi:tyrosinase
MNVSTTAWFPAFDPSKYDSFESAHDTVHTLVGGGNGGNMAIVQLAAFDPIFWMHHTQIDRLTAMWQVLYPDSYLTPDIQKPATYWSAAGMRIDADTGKSTRPNDHKVTLTLWHQN